MNATKRTGNAGMADGSGSVRVIVKGSGLKADSAHVSKKSKNRTWTNHARIEFSEDSGSYMCGWTVSAARTVTKAAGTNGGLYTAAEIKVCD
ncbi:MULTISPECIES: hypothetical protein [Streptomyces]|uniref:hypothetical protein n=2 Tax=Streptomyces TaxID=1883 RepID=UPI000AF64AF8|nr:hypothetical protein [Streptomyces sp. NRRL F-2295]